MKNKTLATWLAFLGGGLGLHRFYLFGPRDRLGWLLPIPTLLGLYGVRRVLQYGQDDVLSWWLVPLLGFTVAACCLNAIVFGLTEQEKWNTRHNPQAPQDAEAGATGWLTIAGAALALAVGAAVLMASLAFSVQRYFEYQVEEAQKISQ